MPRIKDVSKCRRIPKEKQSLCSGDSIDDEDTELDEDFVKMRKLFKESQDQKFIRKLKKKLKEHLLKKQNGASGSSSDAEPPKVQYPEPLTKVEKNKKTGSNELNCIKKPVHAGNLSSKNKSSKSLKKMEEVGKTTTDKRSNNPAATLKSKSDQKSKTDKKDDKPRKFDKKADSDRKMNDKPKRENKGNHFNVPLSKNDRDLTKNEVEAMIRMVLKQSREEGGNAEGIDDVSLGETESTPSEDELDIGKDPEMSSTPDDLTSETISEDENNIVY